MFCQVYRIHKSNLSITIYIAGFWQSNRILCKRQVVNVVTIKSILRITNPLFICIRACLAEACAVRISPKVSAEIGASDNVRARDFSSVPSVAARVNDRIDGIIEVVIIDDVVGTGQIDSIDAVRAGNVAAHRVGVCVSFQSDASLLVVRGIVAAQRIAAAVKIQIDAVAIVRAGIVSLQRVAVSVILQIDAFDVVFGFIVAAHPVAFVLILQIDSVAVVRVGSVAAQRVAAGREQIDAVEIFVRVSNVACEIINF
ncbi:Uncharacterised protein [uncultured archaeon]|nr:Uncharacterised protein [uncultured archaeon]